MTPSTTLLSLPQFHSSSFKPRLALSALTHRYCALISSIITIPLYLNTTAAQYSGSLQCSVFLWNFRSTIKTNRTFDDEYPFN